MSNGLMFDDIIMKIFSNKAFKSHVEVVDIYFTKTDTNKMYLYWGSLQDIYWKKGTHAILDVVCPHLNVGRI